MIGSVTIKANPVLAWEQFDLNLDRSEIENPRIQHRDIGGFWSFTFGVSRSITNQYFTSDFLTKGGMREVVAYNARTGQPEFEGFIKAVVENTGTVESVLNLSDVFNRRWARYNSGGSILRSTVNNDTDSQARIGIREKVDVAGDVSLSIADQYVQSLMDWTSFPGPVTRQIDFSGTVVGGSTPTPELEIQCRGYWDTLFTRTYNQTGSSGDADASAIVQAIITASGQFVSSTEIHDNVSPIEQEADADRMAGELIESIASVGDSGYNRWVAGFEAGRKFYYRQAARPVR